MEIRIAFTKVSGAGNDFIVIDNRDSVLPDNIAALSRQICSRHFGVGADGLLLLERSSRAHFAMRYFNLDGSFGGMCGNGGRCIARYAFLNGIAPGQMAFEALDFLYHARVLGNHVSLTMKDPTNLREDIEIVFDQTVYPGYFVNTGSPHFIQFVEDVSKVDVLGIGRFLRHHATFMPEGTNVDFVEVTEGKGVKLRTYERGVESETLACGTGAVATGIISHIYRGLPFPITIQVQSGEFLRVSADSNAGITHSPTLEGSAHILFSGNLLYDSEVHRIIGPK